jgi:hypothetical protein
MKNTKVLWIYAALAAGCTLWFAGCDTMMEILGFGSVEDVQNLPKGGGDETPSPGGMDDQSPLVIEDDESPLVIEDDENPLVIEDDEDTLLVEDGDYVFDPEILSFYVSGSGSDSSSDGTVKATPFKTLAKAYTAALADVTHKRIVVLSNLDETGLVTLSQADATGSTILIEGKTAGLKIERSDGANDSVLAITGGAKIAFKNILINGKIAASDDANANNRALAIGGAGTEVTLGNGTVITGKQYGINSAVTGKAYHGSGIRLYDKATLVMEGNSTVTGCVGLNQCRGAIIVQSGGFLWMKENASVTGNAVSTVAPCGGVYIQGFKDGVKSRFVLDNGKIHDNEAGTHGGGVEATGDGTFTMNGGVVSGNTASQAGGVYVNSTGFFTMTGGVIYGNEDALDNDLRNTATTGASLLVIGGATDRAKQEWPNNTSTNLTTTNDTIDMRSP